MPNKIDRSLGVKMLKLFPSPARRANSPGTAGSKSDAAAVRLIDAPRRLPETLIEQQLVSRLLKEPGAVSFSTLVNAVATDLYTDELRNGAGVLDIGLFGSRLFNNEVIQELKAGDGILWKIKQKGAMDD